MHWVYLSAHLDDAVYSCGGLIWQQVQAGDAVSVWTLFAGDPQPNQLSPYAASLHRRWGAGLDAVAIRREEDARACGILGASYRHFPWPDCIYRRTGETSAPLIKSDQDLFAPYPAFEHDLMSDIHDGLSGLLTDEHILVAPLAAGGHMDHRLVKDVAFTLKAAGWHYADVPYVLTDPAAPEEVNRWATDIRQNTVTLTAFDHWMEAMAAYQSQLSTFWPSGERMKEEMRAYWLAGGGGSLWELRRSG